MNMLKKWKIRLQIATLMVVTPKIYLEVSVDALANIVDGEDTLFEHMDNFVNMVNSKLVKPVSIKETVSNVRYVNRAYKELEANTFKAFDQVLNS